MTLQSPADDEVVALRYDEPAAAEELAAWCDGRVVPVPGAPEAPPAIWVPTQGEARPALLGDWIIKQGTDRWLTCSPEDFAARFEPAAE